MYTSVGLFALAAAVAQPALPQETTWLRDYSKGQEQAARENKPLVVVVGTGAEGFEKLAKEGNLGKDVEQILADSYVRVYLDRSQSSQAKLIRDLSIGTDTGLVISDRKGEVMAFHHEGTLAQHDLKTHLRTYASPSLEVRTTQTHNTTRTSFYPGSSPGYPGSYPGAYPGYAPSYGPSFGPSFAPSFAPAFRGGGGGSC